MITEQEVDHISDVTQEMEAQTQLRKQKKRKWRLLILLLLLLIGVGATLWYMNQSRPKGDGGLIYFDESAKSGNLPGKSKEEIQAELDLIVEEGMFNISIADEVFFENGSKEGAVRIENVKANPYYMQVSITLDDTGETIYESKAIKQDQYIEKIKLNKKLSKGSYPATAVFTALDQTTFDAVGTAAAKITLNVEN